MTNEATIEVRITDAAGQLLRTSDLMPLLPPLASLLQDIEAHGGPAIAGDSVLYEERAFPVFEIDGRRIACVLSAERTCDEAETHWLWSLRRKGLGGAFHDLTHDRWRTVDRLGNSPSAARAALILTGAFETAILVVRTGAISRKVGDFIFHGRCTATRRRNEHDPAALGGRPTYPANGTVH